MLPKTLNKEELKNWIINNSKEEFDDVRKEYFTEEELIEMKSQSHKMGSEINRLTDLKKSINDAITNGNEIEGFVIDIPTTDGLKELTKRRREMDDEISKGYVTNETRAYGIPSEDGNMHYFDEEGNEFTDRQRKLSGRENTEYNGMFAQLGEEKVQITKQG